MQKIYRSREGFIRRNIANCEVIIPIGGNVADFNGFIELNSTACFIWDRLTSGISKQELIDEMCRSFDEIGKAEAESDIDEFFAVLIEHKMIEEVK